MDRKVLGIFIGSLVCILGGGTIISLALHVLGISFTNMFAVYFLFVGVALIFLGVRLLKIKV